MAAARRAEPPLSRWYHVGAYDSKAACENMIGYFANQAMQHNEAERWRYSKAQCVDSDDPRLTESDVRARSKLSACKIRFRRGIRRFLSAAPKWLGPGE